MTRTNIGTIAPAFAANIPLQLIDNSWGRVEAGAETAVGCWNQRGLNLQNRHVRRPAFALPAAPIILFSLRTASLTRWRSKRSRRRHRRSASLSQLAPCPPSPNSSSEDVEEVEMFANEISEEKLASGGGVAGVENSDRDPPRASLMDRHGIRTPAVHSVRRHGPRSGAA